MTADPLPTLTCSFCGEQVATSPKKAESRAKAWTAFEAYSRLAQPLIQSIVIPFEGKQIKFTLQRPPGVSRPPDGMSGGGVLRPAASAR